tara:strand:+ start:1237 stop:2247 length:1011 start_codon:yes stop_codon:yes gene_type:complete
MAKNPPPPEAPDYAAANREGILTDIETLPVRRQLDVASRLGQKGSFELDGETFEYDFTGLGDADVNRAQLSTNRESAFGQAQDFLDIQSEFGQQFLDTSREQLKASDPIGFALREKLGGDVTSELAAGRGLSGDQLRSVQQSTRASQTARGNINGLAPAVQEALSTSQFSDQRFQQRQQNAAAFLSGTTPLSQFGQLRQAGAGAAPFQALAGNAVGLDRNAGAAAAAFSQQSFGTNSQNYATQSAQTSPWMEGLGMVTGAATSLGSAALIGCWVAREVYGNDNPKWKQFREWVATEASDDFREFYIANGEKLAESIKDKPEVKAHIRKWMDTKIKD